MPRDIQKQIQRQNDWRKENKERIDVIFPKGTKERVKAAAEITGETPSEFIRQAVNIRLEQTETKS